MAEKDTRKILRGVQFFESPKGKKAGAMRTYVEGEEDVLEGRMTKAQHDHLLEKGAIMGAWHPKGKEEPKAAPGDDVAALKARISSLEKQLATQPARAEVKEEAKEEPEEKIVPDPRTVPHPPHHPHKGK